MSVNGSANLRLKRLSSAGVRALASRRESLPFLEKAALLRLKGSFRYDPCLRDIVEQMNAFRDDIGDIVHDEQFDRQVPRAEEVRCSPWQTSPERTLTSVLRTARRLAAYIDALLQAHNTSEPAATVRSRSAAA